MSAGSPGGRPRAKGQATWQICADASDRPVLGSRPTRHRYLTSRSSPARGTDLAGFAGHIGTSTRRRSGRRQQPPGPKPARPQATRRHPSRPRPSHRGSGRRQSRSRTNRSPPRHSGPDATSQAPGVTPGPRFVRRLDTVSCDVPRQAVVIRQRAGLQGPLGALPLLFEERPCGGRPIDRCQLAVGHDDPLGDDPAPDVNGLRTLATHVLRQGQEVGAAIESITGARFVHDTVEFAGWDCPRRRTASAPSPRADRCS